MQRLCNVFLLRSLRNYKVTRETIENMGKIKFTKGELKRQRDALRQYSRYLPTLQLKKQQLQIEILRQSVVMKEKMLDEAGKKAVVLEWAGLLSDSGINLRAWVTPEDVFTGLRNIAGVDLPVFKEAKFKPAEYDLFITPLWVDSAVASLRVLVSLQEEIRILKKGIAVLRDELRITTQRVNLFEKVKIPEAREAIRRIKIYLGDQTSNAIGRSKIAKRKIEELVLQGAFE
jgi:V/A-type H+-transporting ATPase subunit D